MCMNVDGRAVKPGINANYTILKLEPLKPPNPLSVFPRSREIEALPSFEGLIPSQRDRKDPLCPQEKPFL